MYTHSIYIYIYVWCVYFYVLFVYVCMYCEGQTFDPHPHPGGFTKLPECPVASLVVVLGFHWQWGWVSKG